MIKCLLLLLLSFNAYAFSPAPPESTLYLCQWEWSHDFKRTDETVMKPDEMWYYRIVINGEVIKQYNPSKKGKYFFFTYDTGTCPLKLPVSAVDSDSRESDTAYAKRRVSTQ